MRPKFQSKQEVIINAPLEKVWEFNMDLSKIADYHPRVNQVDLISGKQFRETGVSYQCHLKDGKNTCIEQDIEIVPMQKLVTVFPQDTMGLSKLLPDYVVESNLSKIGDNATKVEMSHFYSSSRVIVWLLNFIIKRKFARETQDTLNAMKKTSNLILGIDNACHKSGVAAVSQDIAKTKKRPMEYRLEGSGPTVMVLNGGHCSRESRLSHEQFANNGFSVLTPSRPGYDSTPSDPLTPVAYFCSCSVTASHLPAYLF